MTTNQNLISPIIARSFGSLGSIKGARFLPKLSSEPRNFSRVKLLAIPIQVFEVFFITLVLTPFSILKFKQLILFPLIVAFTLKARTHVFSPYLVLRICTVLARKNNKILSWLMVFIETRKFESDLLQVRGIV